MAWTWRRKTPSWQRHLDRLLDVVIAVLAMVFLAELFLLLK
jgi:lipopolysaccharide/colanic/teichoic acid biosynthesis glycosyltransferase